MKNMVDILQDNRLCNIDHTSKVENVCRAALNRNGWDARHVRDAHHPDGWGSCGVDAAAEEAFECVAHFA